MKSQLNRVKTHAKTYKPQGTDLATVVKESKKRVESLVDALETLRLLCEGHHQGFQEFLRIQSDDGFKRPNSVNMILSVTDILIHYIQIVDDANTELGNKMFEYFVELLQGPCIENQKEICETKLLETVEDLLINLTNLKKEDDQQGMSLSDNMSELTKSELIVNVINFMLSIIEGTHDNFILGKVSIHVNQDMFLRRLRKIYNLFKVDIDKNLIGAFPINLKLPINLKSLGLGGKKDKKAALMSHTESMNKEDEEEYTVLVDKKTNYHPIIMEGL
jgi:RyR and IP3R Homology associated